MNFWGWLRRTGNGGTTRGSKIRPSPKGTRKNPNKMNCNPVVEGKTVSKDTCYTSDALLKIKEAYNKHNLENAIVATDPTVIFNELKHKMTKCKKEDCWLKELPATEQKYLDTYLFAPDKPQEWKKKKNEWLSNIDIFEVLKQYEAKYTNFKLFEPTPIDFDKRLPEENGKCVQEELCVISLKDLVADNKNKIGVIFNLDEHDEDGSHWTAMFVDIENRVIFYFDSAANRTPKEVKTLVKKIRKQGKELSVPIKFKYYENYPRRHQGGASECGMYSLFFIITMLTDKTDFDSNMTMDKKLDLFLHKKIPDKYVSQYRNVYFND